MTRSAVPTMAAAIAAFATDRLAPGRQGRDARRHQVTPQPAGSCTRSTGDSHRDDVPFGTVGGVPCPATVRGKPSMMMTEILRHPGLLSSRLARVHSHGRVADSLLGIALDALVPYASDYLSAADYQRLCALVNGPVAAATDTAIATLAAELVEAIAAADPELASRLTGLRGGTALPVD